MRETKLKVLHQGEVKLCHDTGYSVVGNDEVVCFYIDVDRRIDVDSWTHSDADCPVLNLGDTAVELTEFPGWSFHSSSGGDSVAIALVSRCGVAIPELTISAEAEEDKVPWPKHGKAYHVVFEVEYIGKHWEDQPRIDVVYCHADLDYILSEQGLCDLVDSDELPIASGTYSASLTYHHYPHTDWETGGREDDYGFTVSNLKHISPSTTEYKVGALRGNLY